jgi:hypothetical protein
MFTLLIPHTSLNIPNRGMICPPGHYLVSHLPASILKAHLFLVVVSSRPPEVWQDGCR